MDAVWFPRTDRVIDAAHAHNLTELEILALDADVNLADGHPRQDLTRTQRAIVDRMPELFDVARHTPFEDLENRAHGAFLHALGQHGAPVGAGRIYSAYASSVGMDVVARCLAEAAPRVGLIHPTFDNIPDLLKAWSVQLVPLEEEELGARAIERAGDLDAVFLTTPNNPTGHVVDAATMGEIAEYCAAREMVLVLDTSFRGFDTRAQYDSYELLDGTGVEYVVIEDTGKLWPTLELKLGMVVESRRNRLDVERAMSDILLSVSPFVLLMVEALANDAAEGGFAQLHDLVAENRALLRGALEDARQGRVIDNGTRISVERIRLADGLSAKTLSEELRRSGIHVLPCGSFHWARQEECDNCLRIALGRDADTLRRALPELQRVLEAVADPAVQSTA